MRRRSSTIRDRLTELGVESQVVEGVVTRNDFNQVFAGRLRNVIARIPGTDSTGAVLMLSHFDSVPTSMNANDGGLGVAAVLETVRAIQAGPPLINDVVLWFGDADETTALNALLLQRPSVVPRRPLRVRVRGARRHRSQRAHVRRPGGPDGEPPLLSLGEERRHSPSAGRRLSSDNGRWLREALEAVPDLIVALPLNDLASGCLS